jgi:hypothetical protein
MLELCQRSNTILVDLNSQLYLLTPRWLIKSKRLTLVRLDHVWLHLMN